MTEPRALDSQVEGRGARHLVLIHGFGASRFTWRFWRADLAARFRIHLIDLKGCGSAARPDDGRYAPGDLAEELVGYVSDSGLADYVLVGHSLGGGLALLTYLTLMDRGLALPRGLVLIGPAAYPQAMPRLISLSRIPVLGTLIFSVLPASKVARLALKSAYHPDRTPNTQTVEGYAAPLRLPGARRALRDTAVRLNPAEADRLILRYPSVGCPALLLQGRQDRVVPPWVTRRLHEELPSSRLLHFDGCGHVPQEEVPEISLRGVLAFLRTEVWAGAESVDSL